MCDFTFKKYRYKNFIKIALETQIGCKNNPSRPKVNKGGHLVKKGGEQELTKSTKDEKQVLLWAVICLHSNLSIKVFNSNNVLSLSSKQ